MDWRKGFSARYYLTTLDEITWRDVSKVEIIGGSVDRQLTGLRESASIDCINFGVGTEQWVRIWLDARQAGDTQHVPLFTGLATSPEKSIDGNLVSNTLECYSVLKPAEDILLDRGWYAPAGISGSHIIKQLLKVTPAPVVEEEFAPVLSQSIIAEEGESHLSMVDKILKAINWRLRITGNGIISIESKPSSPTINMNCLDNDIIEPQVSSNRDWYSCPNVFRAVQNDLMGVARDDSLDSVLSTVNRGREVWMEETNCSINAGETIAEYALRRLKEEQSVDMTIKYDRRFVPDVVPSDIVRLHYPEQLIDGLFEVVVQNISLGYGSKVSEEVKKYGKQ